MLFRQYFIGFACILPVLAQAASVLDRAPATTRSPAHSRIVIVENPEATSALKPQPETVRDLVSLGITTLTGRTNAAAAWRTVFSTQDVIGIKVYSQPGAQVGTRPAVVAGIIEGLLAAKIPTNQIVIWDRRLSDLQRAEFLNVARLYGVRIAGALDSGWDEKVAYDSALLGQLVYGDLEFQKEGEGAGRKSFVSRLLTKEVTKIVNVSPLLNHNSLGVCGNLYSLAMGSVDNTIRFEGDASKLAQAVPEIYALAPLGDRVALNVVDALICQYEGERISRLHNSIELNQLRFSADPVALDMLSVQEIRTQRDRALGTLLTRTNRTDLYKNAALLELGVADLKNIEIEFVKSAPP